MNDALGIGMMGMPELLLVLGIMLLIFGGTRLPQLAKGLGSSIREFKRGAAGIEEAAALGEAASGAKQQLD
jgi:sec-independent protein translocase protein TatA